jgi:V/A-type H+-transporting ATPase subunit B
VRGSEPCARDFVRYTKVLAIVGDILQVALSERDGEATDKAAAERSGAGHAGREEPRLAQVIRIEGQVASLQVFSWDEGSRPRPGELSRPSARGDLLTPIFLGGSFGGTGSPIDGGPDLDHDPKIRIGGRPPNPARRVLAFQDDPHRTCR